LTATRTSNAVKNYELNTWMQAGVTVRLAAHSPDGQQAQPQANHVGMLADWPAGGITVMAD
jgi:hypothetical protein